MLKIKDGIVEHRRISRQIYSDIEQGEMKLIRGIIIHQTSSESAITTLFQYAVPFLNHGNGAHFLINPSGLIYQTARTTQQCWHVGRIKSMCATINACSPRYQIIIDRIENELTAGMISEEEAWKRVDLLEQAKNTSERYPSNQDSIGIELVGAPVNKSYIAPPPIQNDSAQWLVSELLDTFHLQVDRIYAHGFISPHKNQTEAGLFNYSHHNR